jgi:hypothetical protein
MSELPPDPYAAPPGHAPYPTQYGNQYQQGYLKPTNGQALAALAVAIVGLFVALMPFLGLALPVLALVLGRVGLRRSQAAGVGRDQSIAAMIIGALGLLLALFMTVALAFYLANSGL